MVHEECSSVTISPGSSQLAAAAAAAVHQPIPQSQYFQSHHQQCSNLDSPKTFLNTSKTIYPHNNNPNIPWKMFLLQTTQEKQCQICQSISKKEELQLHKNCSQRMLEKLQQLTVPHKIYQSLSQAQRVDATCALKTGTRR
jgi:hypothetical protein